MAGDAVNPSLEAWPRHPWRGYPRHPPGLIRFPAHRGKIKRKNQKQKPVLQAFVSTKVDTYQGALLAKHSSQGPGPTPPTHGMQAFAVDVDVDSAGAGLQALPESTPPQQASATAVRGRPSHASSRPDAASRPPATGIAA